MLINHNREKLLNLIIYFSKNTKKCFKTKLFKLLYYSDFIHFKETGKSITGMHYKAWGYGPVPSELYFELKDPKDDFNDFIGVIKGEKSIKLVGRKKFDSKYFTDRELNIIERVAFIFDEADTSLTVESTHLRNLPWDKTIKEKGEGATIDYRLALDGTPESISEDDYEHRLQVDKEIEGIFHG